jgi:hypothetical protein
MPAATNLGLAKKALTSLVTQQPTAGLLGVSSPLGTINELTALLFQYNKPAADGAAATATADTLIWTNPFAHTVFVVGAYGVGVGAGIVADAANQAVISLKTNDGAGGATAVATSITTDIATGSWTSNQSKLFPLANLQLGNAAIPPGGGLWFNIAKNGTGVVVPISNYSVKLYHAED